MHQPEAWQLCSAPCYSQSHMDALHFCCRKASRELAALRAAGVPLPAQVDVHMPNLRDVGDRGELRLIC